MSQLNLEIRKTLSAEKPYAVFIDGQQQAEFETLGDARKYIQQNCVILKDPARFFVQPPDEEANNDLNALKSLDIIAFNQGAENRFVELVTAFLEEEGPQPVNTVVSEASFELDISPATVKRYLQKHSARRAKFLIQEKLVRLRKPRPKSERPSATPATLVPGEKNKG